MKTIENTLERETYKQGGVDVATRVFYTLIGEKDNPHREKLQAHRNSKAIARLFKVLHEKHHITNKQLDEILLDVIG